MYVFVSSAYGRHGGPDNRLRGCRYSFGVSAAKVIGVILSLLLVPPSALCYWQGRRRCTLLVGTFLHSDGLGKRMVIRCRQCCGSAIALTLLLIVTSTFDSIIIFWCYFSA